jgi:hypothetical protein
MLFFNALDEKHITDTLATAQIANKNGFSYK